MKLCDEETTSGGKIHLFSQHWHDTRDLFLCIKTWRIGDGLKIYCHLVVHSCHDVLELQLLSVLADHFAQRLHEPGAARGVPPRVVAWREMRDGRYRYSEKGDNTRVKGFPSECVWVFTWGCGEGVEVVSFHGDPDRTIVYTVRLNPSIQVSASASLLHVHTNTTGTGYRSHT